jgi:hypothetical protein
MDEYGNMVPASNYIWTNKGLCYSESHDLKTGEGMCYS